MTECKKCKKRSLSSYNKIAWPISIFVLVTSTVGVVTIVKYILSFF